MALIKLNNLTNLSLSMIQNNFYHQVFNFTYNSISFSSLLIYEVKNFKVKNSQKFYTLSIFKKGTTQNVTFDLVKKGNELFIDSYLPNYYEVLRFLNIKYDPNNTFHPKAFFDFIDNKSPTNASNSNIDRKVCAKYYPTTKDNEQDKIYFLSFKDNDKSGQKRSFENYRKTEMFIPEANKIIGNRNISVRFTAEENYRYNESDNIRRKSMSMI